MKERLDILLAQLTTFGIFDKRGQMFNFPNSDLELCISGEKSGAKGTTATLFSTVGGHRSLVGGISSNGSVNHPALVGALAEFEKQLCVVVDELITRRAALQDIANTPLFDTEPVIEPPLVNQAVGDVSGEWIDWFTKKHNVDRDYAWYQGMILLMDLNLRISGTIARSFQSNIRHLAKPKDKDRKE